MKLPFKIIIYILISTCFAYSQNEKFTKRPRNEVREGPGNYFDLLRVLSSGVKISVLKTEGNWVNINTPDHTKGWMAKNCLSDEKPMNTEIKDLDKEWSSPKASKAGVAAAIRGFAQRYGETHGGDIAFLESVDKQFITTNDFKVFLTQTQSQTKQVPFNEISNDAEKYFGDYSFADGEEKIGAGIASQVAAEGLVKDEKLLKYINLVGTYLFSSSPMYDIHFRFFVLDIPIPNAFAIPGGYIFVTKGMLELCSNEAELAGAISHELMHIVLHHGMKEMQHRKPEQKMDAEFDALEAETQSSDTTEDALNAMARDMFDVINKPRTILMEEEADKGAAILLAHCGYSPSSLVNLVSKIESYAQNSATQELDDEQPFASLSFKERKEVLQKYLKEKFEKNQGKDFQKRYQDNIKLK